MLQLFIDIETTGREVGRHGIHQLAGFVIVDGAIKDSFDIKVHPAYYSKVDPDAMYMCGIERNEMLRYQPMNMGFRQFTALLEKYTNVSTNERFILAGYGIAGFDMPFLRRWFVDNEAPELLFSEHIQSLPYDIMVLAGDYILRNGIEVTSWSLESVARALGVPVETERFHKEPMYDIEVTMEIYNLIKDK